MNDLYKYQMNNIAFHQPIHIPRMPIANPNRNHHSTTTEPSKNTWVDTPRAKHFEYGICTICTIILIVYIIKIIKDFINKE